MTESQEKVLKKELDSDKIWKEIAELPMAIFSLPNQRVKDHVKRLAGFNDTVLLTLNSAAVLPSLESALMARQGVYETTANTPHGDKIKQSYPLYVMEQAEGYVMIKRNSPPPERDELQPLGKFFISSSESEKK